jgi:prepilin-type N-terminal cleavage/methylation domain-containing protein
MRVPVARGFTLVELLVVIAIIGVFVAMMIPAVQASRETARRHQCESNLSRLVLALHAYENSFEKLPAGVVNPDGPIRSEPVGLHQGWLIQMLPYLDEQNAFRLIDFSKSVYDPANAAVRGHWPHVYICPSEVDDVQGASNYAGCQNDAEAPIAEDNHGVLFLNSQVRREDISDGLGYTLFAAEKIADTDDLGWMSGTRATLRNTGRLPNSSVPLPTPPAPEGLPLTFVGGFASHHPGGLNAARGDGSVQFVSNEIDADLWRRLGDRSDGQLIHDPRPD